MSSQRAQMVARSLRARSRKYLDLQRRERVAKVRAMGENMPGLQASQDDVPADLRKIRDGYRVAPDLELVDGKVPLIWWADAPN